MIDQTFSRRVFLGAASVAAIGASVGEVAAADARKADEPRLPLKILLRSGLDEASRNAIAKLSPQIVIARDVPLEEAAVIFGYVGEKELDVAKKLRWVMCQSAGVEHYPLEAMLRHDIILTNAQGCHGPQIAEHAFALLFALTRGIGTFSRRREWGGGVEPIELRGLTMGIIGLGAIGREVALRAKAMGMKVIAVDAEPLFVEKFAMADEVRLVDDGLMDLLRRSDVVVCCAPHTPRTREMLGAEQFAAIKSGGYFINISRGKIVQTDALVEALKSGHLAGAGLDVTDPEPLPADHPLWKEERAVITPHVAGKSQLGYGRVQRVFIENVARFIGRKPLLNVVDKAKGY